ncbi:hypothetical protein MEO93_27245, partial [Dolichospermum sp. ST_sed3]|nr:hypothetical protein [Dolichospermum sp. ST_sed3]
AEDFDFLYMILEEIYKKSVILITNYPSKINELDERIRSRLMPELISFKAYKVEEIKGILQERINYAYFDGVFSPETLQPIVQKTFESTDIRMGLFLLKESANSAEDRSRKQVIMEDVEKALIQIGEFKRKEAGKLEDDLKDILEFVKANSGKKIGELFSEYQKINKDIIYKTFQRKIKKLADNGYVQTKIVTGGIGGSTTIVEYDSNKKLTDF